MALTGVGTVLITLINGVPCVLLLPNSRIPVYCNLCTRWVLFLRSAYELTIAIDPSAEKAVLSRIR